MAFDVEAAYAQLKKLESSSLIDVPETQETIEVGVIDPKQGTFDWAVPTVTQTIRVAPPPGTHKPQPPIELIVGVVSTKAVDLRLRFAVVPLRRRPVATQLRTVVSLSGGVVGDPFEWNGGVTVSGFPTVSSTANEITIDLGHVYSTIMQTTSTTPPIARIDAMINFLDYEAIPVHLFVLRPPVLGVGAFTMPALPMTIVYAPPQGKTAQNTQTYSHSQVLTRTLTTSLTTATSTQTAQAYSASDLIAKASAAIAAVVAIVGTGGAAASGPTVVGALEQLGAAVFGPIEKDNDSIADALGKAKDELSNLATVLGGFVPPTTAEQQVGVTTEDDHSVTLTSSSLEQFGSEQRLGPGLGDRIVYLKNVRVVWMAVGGNVDIVVLGYQGIGANGVQDLVQEQQALAGGAAPTLGLDETTISYLLAVDPLHRRPSHRPVAPPVVVTGPPVVGPPRYVPATPPGRSGTGTSAAGDVFEASFATTTDQSHTVTRARSTVTDVKPAWIPVLFGLADNQETTTVTTFTTATTTDARSEDKLTSTVTLVSTGLDDPYDVKIFYDNTFGTYAILDAGSPLLRGGPTTAEA